MGYTATALLRTGGEWSGRDLDLAGVDDLDRLADLLRDDADGADVVMCFLEEDDEYVAVVRAEGEDEPRVFVSDRRALEGTGLAGRLFADAMPIDEPEDEDEEEDSGRPEVEPAGDPALLTDLGVNSEAHLDLCAEEGMLPSDVIFAACEKAGCAEVLEEVRGV